MKRLILLIVLLLNACSIGSQPDLPKGNTVKIELIQPKDIVNIGRFVDTDYGIVCYIVGRSISCVKI